MVGFLEKVSSLLRRYQKNSLSSPSCILLSAFDIKDCYIHPSVMREASLWTEPGDQVYSVNNKIMERTLASGNIVKSLNEPP